VKRAIVVRHVAFEDLGILAPVLAARGYQIAYLDGGVDDLKRVNFAADDLLIVLGGPIGAYEERTYPFLRDELQLIEAALRRNVPTLGICLGAQLLARALGARVYRGPAREIGIGPVALTPAGLQSPLRHLNKDRLALHWHGDTFDLPANAALLASTEITPNQAFAAGRALGLQFHIEAEPRAFERWLIGHASELAGAGIDIPALRDLAVQQLPGVSAAGAKVLSAWLDGVDSGGAT
jgi:GMP synthase (glutamine-hydrolysing)